MPYLNFPILWTRSQHLWISTEVNAEDSIIMHHEGIISLILKIFLKLSSDVVPNLYESINWAWNKVLTIWREASTFWVANKDLILSFIISVIIWQFHFYLSLINISLSCWTDNIIHFYKNYIMHAIPNMGTITDLQGHKEFCGSSDYSQLSH